MKKLGLFSLLVINGLQCAESMKELSREEKLALAEQQLRHDTDVNIIQKINKDRAIQSIASMEESIALLEQYKPEDRPNLITVLNSTFGISSIDEVFSFLKLMNSDKMRKLAPRFTATATPEKISTAILTGLKAALTIPAEKDKNTGKIITKEINRTLPEYYASVTFDTSKHEHKELEEILKIEQDTKKQYLEVFTMPSSEIAEKKQITKVQRRAQAKIQLQRMQNLTIEDIHTLFETTESSK